MKNIDGQSATSLAECLGVDIHFVLKAIDARRLKAQKRETHRTENQGGDIWYIKQKDIRCYVLNYLTEIDIRKVDKYWLCDILANK